MPKVTINDHQGLLIEPGSGLIINSNVTINGAGVESTVYSSDIAIANAAASYEGNVTVPAHALITDMGVIFTSALDQQAAASGTVTSVLSVSAVHSGEYLAGAVIVASNQDVIINSAISVSAQNKCAGGASAALGTFVAGRRLFHSSSRPVHCRLTTSQNLEGSTTSSYRFYVKYIVIK
jgi:hypothetical protein